MEERQILWKDIPNFNGNYEISSVGDIFSNFSDKILKQGITNGYRTVRLYLGGRRKSKIFKIHRLVALTFLSTDNTELCVNHINGDKLDNRVENLTWATSRENSLHAHENKLITTFTKPVIQLENNDNELKEIARFNSIIEASEKTRAHPSQISAVCKGKIKLAGGFRWKYVNEDVNEISPESIETKPIPDYPNYLITKSGEVFSKNVNKWIKTHVDGDGYVKVNIRKDKNQRIQHLVHRLVALTFLDNPKNLPLVDHINRIRSDNRVENLRWVTHQENKNYSLEFNKKSLKCRPIAQFSKDDILIKEFDSITEASKATGISIGIISNFLRNKPSRGGGFKWKYLDDEKIDS